MADIELRSVVIDNDPVNKALFRNTIIRRYAYAIADSENPADLSVNEDGVVPYYLIYGGRLFWLDAGDMTPGPGDNVTLIITADGYRYFSDGQIVPVWSVLSQADNDPPGAPNVGDAYHTGPAPTGDWAGYPNKIAVYTRRGWLFQNIPVGRALYVVDETSYYHMDENGAFVLGMGTATVAANSVRDIMLVGGQRFYTVENQDTTTPPVSPGLGVYWIVGGGATGEWAGQDGKIATNYGSGWVFITPIEGWHAYDKSLNALYVFNGTIWQVAFGAWSQVLSIQRSSNLVNTNTSASYVIASESQVDFTARKTGTRRLRYIVSYGGFGVSKTSPSTATLTGRLAIRRDTETNPIEIIDTLTPSSSSGSQSSTRSESNTYTRMGYIDVSDLSSHQYTLVAEVRSVSGVLSSANVTVTGPISFTIEEVA